MDEGPELFAERFSQHARQQRLARARDAGQHRPATAILDRVAQLQQRRLVGLARPVEPRIGGVLEGLLLKLPVGLVHGSAMPRSFG